MQPDKMSAINGIATNLATDINTTNKPINNISSKNNFDTFIPIPPPYTEIDPNKKILRQVRICQNCQTILKASTTLEQHNEKCPEAIVNVKVKPTTDTEFTFPTPRKLTTTSVYQHIKNRFSSPMFLGQHEVVHCNITDHDFESDFTIVKFNIFERSKQVTSCRNDLDLKHVKAMLKITKDTEDKLLLYIDILDQHKHSYRRINKPDNGDCSYAMIPKCIPEKYIKKCSHDSSIKYATLPYKKHTIEIHAKVSDNCSHIVVKQEFTASLIETLYKAYNHNKSMVSKNFIDFVEFFSDTGLSNNYKEIYGNNISWNFKMYAK